MPLLWMYMFSHLPKYNQNFVFSFLSDMAIFHSWKPNYTYTSAYAIHLKVYVRDCYIIPQRQEALACRRIGELTRMTEQEENTKKTLFVPKVFSNMIASKNSESCVSSYSRMAFLVLIHCVCIIFTIFITLQSRPGSSEFPYWISSAHNLRVCLETE